MKRFLLLAAFAALLIVPVASASGHDLYGSYYTGNFYPRASAGQVDMIFMWSSGFPSSGAYQIHNDVVCDNGFVGTDQIAAYNADSWEDVFVTGAGNCTATLSYTHANKAPVFLDQISFVVPA